MVGDALDVRYVSNPRGSSDVVLQARALACYALYKTHNGSRHHTFVADELPGAFQAYLRKGRLASQME